MAQSKGAVLINNNVLGGIKLSGATITGISLWRHGIVDVTEISFTGGSTTSPMYIKHNNGQSEYGGTPDWGTGTRAY